jgi:hypothetical protein
MKNEKLETAAWGLPGNCNIETGGRGAAVKDWMYNLQIRNAKKPKCRLINTVNSTVHMVFSPM